MIDGKRDVMIYSRYWMILNLLLKNDLEERIDDEEEIEDKYEDEYDALSDDLDNLVDRLEDHQLEYGGLVRLRL